MNTAIVIILGLWAEDLRVRLIDILNQSNVRDSLQCTFPIRKELGVQRKVGVQLSFCADIGEFVGVKVDVHGDEPDVAA